MHPRKSVRWEQPTMQTRRKEDNESLWPAANPLLRSAHRKVLLGMSPSTFSKSRSTGTGASAGALRSLSTTRPLPSMAPITWLVG